MMIPFKIFLTEMSYNRHKVVTEIQNLAPQIKTHFLKLLFVDDKENIDHWVKEIDSWFMKINDMKIKPKNKKLKMKQYFNLFFSEPWEPIDVSRLMLTIKSRLRDYKIKNVDKDHVETKINMIRGIYGEASYKIEQDIYDIHSDDIIKKIKIIAKT